MYWNIHHKNVENVTESQFGHYQVLSRIHLVNLINKFKRLEQLDDVKRQLMFVRIVGWKFRRCCWKCGWKQVNPFRGNHKNLVYHTPVCTSFCIKILAYMLISCSCTTQTICLFDALILGSGNPSSPARVVFDQYSVKNAAGSIVTSNR